MISRNRMCDQFHCVYFTSRSYFYFGRLLGNNIKGDEALFIFFQMFWSFSLYIRFIAVEGNEDYLEREITQIFLGSTHNHDFYTLMVW